MKETYYKIWHWSECPNEIKFKTTLDAGTWVVKYPVGYVFPLSEINLSEHPDYEVESTTDGAYHIVFIKDPENADYLFTRDYDPFGSSRTSPSWPTINLGEYNLDQNESPNE